MKVVLGPRDAAADCVCLLALTLEDLFAADARWVYGYAAIPDAVAVHSMLRYDPGFLDAGLRPEHFEQTIRARALRVLSHELAHLFGLRHCTFFACVMNPSAGLRDVDALPLRLCPICLCKLGESAGFDVAARWRELMILSGELGLWAEQRWFAARLAALAAALADGEASR